jgi:hypothetical protein
MMFGGFRGLLLFQATNNRTMMQQSIGGVLGEGNRGCGGEIKGDTNQFSFIYVFTRSTHSTEAHGGLMEFTGVSW